MTRERLLRLYAAAGAVLTIALLPAAVVRSGSVVEHPLKLAPGATRDGRSRVLSGPPDVKLPASVVEIRYGNGPFRPPARFDALRERPGLPIGTRIAYRLDGPNGPQDFEGAVRTRPATASEQTKTLAWCFVSLGLALATLVLVTAGAGFRSLLAAAAFSGIGYLVALGLLDATLVSIPSEGVRSALVLLSRLFPFDLTYFLLFRLLEIFPIALKPARWRPWVDRTLFALGVLCFLATAAGEVPGFLERALSQPAQAAWLGAEVLLRFAAALICGVAILGLVVGQLQMYRHAGIDPAGRRQARLAGWALLGGAGPALLLVAIQAVGKFLANRLVVPPVVMSLAFVPLLVVPFVVVWISLSPEATPAKLLVRRAALFLLARRSVWTACFVPTALLAFHLWRHRNESLGAVLAEHPVALGVAAVAAVFGLAWRESLQRRVGRWLESAPPDAEEIVSAVGDSARGSESVDELGAALVSEMRKGFGVAEAGLFLLDEQTGTCRAAGRGLPELESNAPAIAAMRKRREPVDLRAKGSTEGSLAATERQARWADATGLSLLVPLLGGHRDLLGFVAVGRKRNELPFAEADRLALRAVATAASLAVENLRLRSSAGSHPHAAGKEAAPAVGPQGDVAAAWCSACQRVFPAGGGGLCSDDGTPLSPADVPHLLAGRYLFERRLGAGGMGTVWEARDLALGRSVAAKTLSRISGGAAARFRREARAAARFLHPNLATILTSETWRGVPVLIFEFLEGGTLAQRKREGVSAPADVAHWGALLAGALHVAHEGGVLHRDVKPSNIGFTADGVPKLLDFGLAAVFDDADERASAVEDATSDRLALSTERTVSRLTRSSAIVGTLPYLSPEAAVGSPAAPSFDLWGLTLSLYEAVTGRNPFLGGTVHGTLEKILTLPVPDPREIRRDCPAALAAVLVRNLSSSPAERARTAAILKAEFLALTTPGSM